MTLDKQFQVFLGSIVLGMLFLGLWSLLNVFLYRLKNSIVRLPIETAFFMGCAYLYYRFLLLICNGVLNIFYPVAILIGAYIYQKFYAPIINRSFNRWYSSLQKFLKRLLKPFKLLYNKLKVKRRKKNGKKKAA